MSTATTGRQLAHRFCKNRSPGGERQGNPSIATQLQILEKLQGSAPAYGWRRWFTWWLVIAAEHTALGSLDSLDADGSVLAHPAAEGSQP
jgi:hypothetical protein